MTTFTQAQANSTAQNGIYGQTGRLPGPATYTFTLTCQGATGTPPAVSSVTVTATSEEPASGEIPEGCDTWSDKNNWNCNTTSKLNPRACLKNGNNTALENIDGIQW